jgi:tetratricopeptide (TPR) repeat protein
MHRCGLPPGAAPPALGLVVAVGVLLLLLSATPSGAQQSDADVLVAQAILAYEDKRYDEALGLLREALAQDPDNLDALYYTGLTLLAQQKPEEAVRPLEQARRRAPGDLALLYQLGVAYFASKDYDRAEGPLTEVFRAQPRTDGVGYYLGFIRYRKRDYTGALEALRAGTASDPDIQQLSRFYAGLALAALGQREEAAREVQEALRLQPSSALTGPAERLRDSMAAPRRTDRRLQIELRAGIVYDTNVLVLPAPSHDRIAEAARQDRDDQASFGEIFSARFDYSFLRKGPWEATVGYQFFQIIYNDLSDQNIQNHVGSASGSYRGTVGGLPYQVGVQYVYDYLTIGDEEFLQRNTAGLFATLVEGPAHLSVLQFRLQTKDFSKEAHIEPAETRDAFNYLVGLLHVFRFAADRHLIRVGYQFDVESARGATTTMPGAGSSWGPSTRFPGGEPGSSTTTTSTSGTTATSTRSSRLTRPPSASARTRSRRTWCGSSSPCRRASRSRSSSRGSWRGPTCPCSATTATSSP